MPLTPGLLRQLVFPSSLVAALDDLLGVCGDLRRKSLLSSCRSRCARLALRPCRLAQGHWEHLVAERRAHLVLLNFFHRNAALEAAILELAEQPISVFRLGRLFAFKERRRSPEERSDRIL